MWPWGRKAMPDEAQAPPDDPDDADDGDRQERKRRLRRRAGCIWGCLTEPLVLGALTLLAVIFGRAYLVRRAQRMRQREQAQDNDNNVAT